MALKQKFINCDSKLCDGCQVCEYACAAEKEGAFATQLSRIKNVRIEPIWMLSIACRACAEPACVKVCPREGALAQVEKNGLVRVDNNKCDGCGWCITACPFGAISMNVNTKRVVICDLCEGLPTPKCVEFCPKLALSVSNPDNIAQKKRSEAASALLEEEDKGVKA